MKWDTIHITDKIHYLKELMMNTTKFDDSDIYIVNALITGSQNTFSGDMGFEVQKHHMDYMRDVWNDSIQNQKDDSVIKKIKQQINKF